ncbi:hypothetical protein GH714_003270 [Hevea brasiliensis]|uniref:F-box domain-containing protein n=1 Tax=Hevea brasiliensis TaxID=3981 RepID=A0A6A6K935_HEVBR|nr:hypothetical protein GH714_003270 [Hevea brasiliensis]
MAVAAKYLPSDVVSDILSRLPLKSLVRFRCVSKPWLQFITHSRFPFWLLYRHLSCDPLSHCPHNQSSLILSYNKRTEVEGSESKLYSFGGGYQEDAFSVAVETDFPLIRGKSFEIKTGCCHGMLCLSIEDDDTLVLWNPSIGDFRTLPSLKRNLWRNLGELAYSLFYEGVPANGCLYWAASKSHKFADRILCLNLSDETFREVPPPPFDPSNSRPIWFQEEEDFFVVAELNLLLWGNSLCVFRQYDQTLWVMKEEKEENGGVRVIWTKMMTIPKISNQEPNYRVYYRLNPKCFTKTGKLVVSVRRKWFVMYDGNKYQDLHIQGLGDGRYQKAIVYTESLISPGSIRGMNDID